VAAIDCGTNAIRLLVADSVPGTRRGAVQLVDVHREERIIRLGEGVDATGRLTTGALDRAWHALADYVAVIRATGADAVRMVATSASRDAENADEFVGMVRRVLGQDPEVISGDDEARLTFAGAVAELAPADGPFLVIDVGGGSTELVVGPGPGGAAGAGDGVGAAVSLDIGSVRITERLLRSDPPRPDEWSAAQAWTDRELADGWRRLGTGPVRGVGTVLAVSGTATTVAAAVLAHRGRDHTDHHLAVLSTPEIDRVAGFLAHANRAHRAAAPWLHPGRVDVIGGGALILDRFAQLVAARTGITRLTVSEHDILDGLALSLL
jgi:exopolyphosphatase/guanosine-5'-triphosphate,3'-diphosphate pyrophosphatase